MTALRCFFRFFQMPGRENSGRAQRDRSRLTAGIRHAAVFSIIFPLPHVIVIALFQSIKKDKGRGALFISTGRQEKSKAY